MDNMKTDAVNRWLTFGANLGVLFGIFFLAFELQQNNELLQAQAEETQAMSIQAATTLDQDFLLLLGSDPALAETWSTYLRAPDTLPEAQRLQASYLMAALIRRLESVYLQHRLGSLSEESWRSRQALFTGIARSAGYSAFLESSASSLSGEAFINYLNQLASNQ